MIVSLPVSLSPCRCRRLTRPFGHRTGLRGLLGGHLDLILRSCFNGAGTVAFDLRPGCFDIARDDVEGDRISSPMVNGLDDAEADDVAVAAAALENFTFFKLRGKNPPALLLGGT